MPNLMLHRNARSVLALATAVLSSAALASSAEAAKWEKPRAVRGDASLSPDKPMVGVDDEGGAVVAWTEMPHRDSMYVDEEGRVRVAWRAPGKKFGKPLLMPEVGARLRDVAVGPDGTAAVLYDTIDPNCSFFCSPPLRLLVRDGDGKFGKPITVTKSAFGGEVEVDGKGVVYVAWQTPDPAGPKVAVAERRPGKKFGKPKLIDGPAGIQGPELAVNDRGDAVVAWIQGREEAVQAAYRKAGGAWGRATGLGHAFEARVAIADNGDTVVVWAINGSGYASFRSANGKFAIGEALAGSGGAAKDIAIDGDGNVLAMFQRQTCTVNCTAPPAFENVALSRSRKTGRWRVQSGFGHGNEEADFAFDDAGTAYGLFTPWVQTIDGKGGVFVAAQRRGQRMGGQKALTKAGSWNGVIDVSSDGKAIGAWVEGVVGGAVHTAVRE